MPTAAAQGSGQFPLKGSMDIPLWQELLSAMETDPIKATVKAKALLEGKNFWIFADTITVIDVGFKVGDEDHAARLAEMRKERKECKERKGIEDKWASGDMTDEERNAALDELDARRDAALIEATRQSTLKEINEQNAKAQAEAQAAAELAAMKAVAVAAREAKTVDYADPKAARQFDAMYAVIKGDPDNAGKTPTEMVQAAHDAVLALRGIAKAAPTPTETPKPRAPREVPQTLAGLPNAGQPIVQDELVAQFNALGGDTRKQERFMAGLTPNQVDKLVRWADSQVVVR